MDAPDRHSGQTESQTDKRTCLSVRLSLRRNLQLHVRLVTCPAYPEIFVVAPFVPTSVVSVTLPHAHNAVSLVFLVWSEGVA